ncbi:sarcosine oxidase subunit alpha family protein [Roseospira navarrensis]|uniref:Sarcosine oxidase subunit alpha family protein n=1 Tax=Roseospira navarrensis TaxID=140058 RepID=A0A7X1ZAZ3_9PROT|nr:sarcosine oxidase subunit alpha family protein [Roseospira navarrensis]MQX35234.1 sarcosine oxidase subunit alpha family protein [Roseospira navarrensis]
MSDRTQDYRLPAGGLIDRTRRIRFRFNHEWMDGHPGDTLASALLANGIHLVGRSMKYHRPRGILAAGAEDPGALIQRRVTGEPARTDPNWRATQTALVDGLEAESVNVWPSVERDLGAVMGALSPVMGAGFYYKIMQGSRFMWQRVYEPLIRKAAGFGTCPDLPDPDRYEQRHVHCDVLVVGGGPAGLAAARAAARSGARVILADEDERFGGSLLARPRTVEGHAGPEWVASVKAMLKANPEVRLLPRTTVFGYYDGNYLMALERVTDHVSLAEAPAGAPRQRLWHIRAKRVVLATGAHERPLVFGDNDRPGIMLAGAAQEYLHRWAVLPGRDVVVFTTNDRAYEAALDLHTAGATIHAIVDARAEPGPALPAAARAAGIRVVTGYVVAGTTGKTHITGASINKLQADGRAQPHCLETIPCDLLLVSGGLSPVVHLFSQSGGKLRYDTDRLAFVPDRAVQAQASVGACAGTFDLAGCLAEGAAAGAEAARLAGFDPGRGAGEAPACDSEPALGSDSPLWQVRYAKGTEFDWGKPFVDLQNDTTAHDIQQAAREGFESVEHVKRYTLTGFGTDQGKTANINGLGVLAEALGRPMGEAGTTTFRPPYTPVTFAAMAGRDRGDHLDPARLTAIHDRHVAMGAEFEDVGQWKRPWYYPRAGESLHEAVARECQAVREGVGILDASTLGKIDIQGPDAAEFLNRVYTNAWKKLAVGRVRYGLMCREDGMVFDDGTTARIAEDRFLMTTTTGGAAAVMDHLEDYLQTEWPDLRVRLTSVTEQWSTVGIAGPKAGILMARLASGQDLSPESFPFMSWRPAIVAGLHARVFRISFTGELQYEVNVPWHQGGALWDAILRVGVDLGVTPYGTETMHVLRAEKGFIIVGQETDGCQTPLDLGMDWIVSKQKPDFIGKRSLSRSDTARPDRRQLVGLMPKDKRRVVPEGSQIVEPGASRGPKPVPMLGFVTSAYWSPALESGFALALVAGGRARLGVTVSVALPSGEVPAVICDPVMFDKEGARRDGLPAA